MGYRVKNYSINELNRISIPGVVSPSLFWALPVGSWSDWEINEFWNLFTKNESACNKFGLILVKEFQRNFKNKSDLDLTSVGAKLSEIVPPGVEHYVRSSAYRDNVSKILILSGGYPQPGWGVLIENRHLPDELEFIINKTIAQMQETGLNDETNVFIDAARDFRQWSKLRVPPKEPNLSDIDRELGFAEKTLTALLNSCEFLKNSNYNSLSENITLATNQIENTKFLKDILPDILHIKSLIQQIVNATYILSVSEDFLITEIAPRISSLIDNTEKREAAFRNLSSDESKKVLKACLYVRSQLGKTLEFNFHDWANKIIHDNPNLIDFNVGKIINSVEEKILIQKNIKHTEEYKYKNLRDSWIQRSEEARTRFHNSSSRAIESQWKIGSSFLIKLEQICRESKLWVRSIPWDPARMVGWKIMATHVKLDTKDLQIAVNDLSEGSSVMSPINTSGSNIADGSYFTDYVHHIAMLKPGFSPRRATRDLISRLLRPTEIISLIQFYSGKVDNINDTNELADILINTLGWLQSEDSKELPLAACIKVEGNNEASILPNINGNDMRKALESFCKDIVDVTFSRLGYDNSEIWSAIDKLIPSYRAHSKAKDWNEEVECMSVGAAGIIMSAFGQLAFPAKEIEIKQFIKTLECLRKILNQTSHHTSAKISQDETCQTGTLVRQVLNDALTFLGDLPWHLDASFVYGIQPKVLSGEAWSHASPTPRLLRVISLNDSLHNSKIKFWNRDRRNPVVPDPVIISRPRKEHGP